MIEYCSKAVDYLGLAYDDRRALFSYSTTIDDRGAVVNDYLLQPSLRYTINTYLGLTEAQRHGGTIEWLGDVDDRVADFLRLHEHEITTCADHGLLLALLAATDPSHPAADRCFDRLDLAVSRQDVGSTLNMQDLGWMLWGASAWSGDARGEALADRLFGLIQSEFLDNASGLPRHCTARYRRNTVSFGSIVYFLRSMHEYGEAFDSDRAREVFSAGVEHMLSIQGGDGGWPWMIDVRSGQPFDLYPIFTVHQDSMAMLFLHPAEQYGIDGVSEAIERSLRWNFGDNELGISMVLTEPYPWVYRSIERDERLPRVRRYLRGLGPAPGGAPVQSERIRINPECRSYHLGWVLYTWSDPARVFPLETPYSEV